MVVSWQAALLLLGMLLLRWRTSSKTTFAWIRRGLHTSSNELEVMAKITTFLVVFVAIFCGWPCLLHFMAGEARYSSSPFHLFEWGRQIFISLMWLVQVLQGRGQFSPQLPVVSSSSLACSSGSVLVRFDLSRFSHCWFSDSVLLWPLTPSSQYFPWQGCNGVCLYRRHPPGHWSG